MKHSGHRSHDAHSISAGSRKVLAFALSITVLMMVVEVAGGILSNSLALLGDAGHMLTDSLALGLSLFAVSFAMRPPTSTKTYGFYRAEILAALANGSVLVLLCGYIFYEAYLRFLNPPLVRSEVMLPVAAIGLVVNVAAAFVLTGQSKRSLNVRGAWLHILGDALSSAGVIVGGLIILLTGWQVVDPIISVLIGLIILKGAVGLVTESANILLEATPKDISLDNVVSEVKELEGVRDIHDVHLWTITSGIYALSAHLLIEDVLTSKSGKILRQVNQVLAERFGIKHTTIQCECEACGDGVVCRLAPED